MHAAAALSLLTAARRGLLILTLLAASLPLLAPPAEAVPNPVVVGFLNDARVGPSNSFFSDPELTRVREFLSLGFDFSTGIGVVQRDVVYETDIATVTAESLTGVHVFIGLVNDPYTAEEIAALQAFNDAGGALLLAADGGSTPLLAEFATVGCGTTKGDGPLTGTITNPTHPIADGPFGTAATYEQWFALGCITSPANGTVVGTNPAGDWGGASIVTIEPGDGTSPTGGPLVLLGDISMMTTRSEAPVHNAADTNAVLVKNLFAYVFANSTAYAPPASEDTIVLGALNGTRDPSNSWFASPYFGTTLGYLQDPLSFGAPGAPVEESITFDTAIQTITAQSLEGVDIFASSLYLRTSYGADELQALRDFNDAGGALIITSDVATASIADLFTVQGCGASQGANTVPTLGDITDPSHPIADGLFGTVTTFEQYFNIGCFPNPPAGASIVGTNPAGTYGGPSIVVLEPGHNGAGSGPVILLSDVDIFHHRDLHDAAVANEVLIKNIFAFAAGYTPVPPTPDVTVPVIESDLTPPTPDGDNGWYTVDVSLDWTVTEAESPGSLTLTGCDDQNVTADQAATEYSCSASSEGGSAGPDTVTVKRDATPPGVTCTTPAPTFAPGSTGSVSATVTDALSGPSATSASTPADTSTIGSFSADVTGSDNAGNETPVACPYSVALSYSFGGFLSPVDKLPTRNVVKAGRAIPVKFRLGGYQGMAIFGGAGADHPTIDGPVSSNTSCSPAGTDTIEQTVTAGSSALTYDAATDTYSYVWKTVATWAGKCRTFELNLADGSAHQVVFQFNK